MNSQIEERAQDAPHGGQLIGRDGAKTAVKALIRHRTRVLGPGERRKLAQHPCRRKLGGPGITWIPIDGLPVMFSALVWRTAAETPVVRVRRPHPGNPGRHLVKSRTKPNTESGSS